MEDYGRSTHNSIYSCEFGIYETGIANERRKLYWDTLVRTSGKNKGGNYITNHTYTRIN